MTGHRVTNVQFTTLVTIFKQNLEIVFYMLLGFMKFLHECC